MATGASRVQNAIKTNLSATDFLFFIKSSSGSLNATMFTGDSAECGDARAMQTRVATNARKATSRAQKIVTNIFGAADIRLDGERPRDITVHDERFYRRVLGTG